MKRIIDELQAKVQHELRQVGMTPRTTFAGTQEEHDEMHRQRALEYLKAIKILSSTFQVRDWLTSNIYHFNDFYDAEAKFNEMVCDAIGDECDVQLLALISEFNNVD